jgi:hypothetical protein
LSCRHDGRRKFGSKRKAIVRWSIDKTHTKEGDKSGLRYAQLAVGRDFGLFGRKWCSTVACNLLAYYRKLGHAARKGNTCLDAQTTQDALRSRRFAPGSSDV